jgi:NAD(P)H dehydrogenase (quinone)
MAQLLWPIHYSLHYMGFSVLPPFLAHGVQGHGYAYQDADAFARRLEHTQREWAARLADLDAARPLAFPGWDDWDADGQAKARLTG